MLVSMFDLVSVVTETIIPLVILVVHHTGVVILQSLRFLHPVGVLPPGTLNRVVRVHKFVVRAVTRMVGLVEACQLFQVFERVFV